MRRQNIGFIKSAGYPIGQNNHRVIRTIAGMRNAQTWAWRKRWTAAYLTLTRGQP